MFLCFLNANSQPIQPDIKVEYREYSTKILMPTFNPISEENERFVNSKELVPAAQAQFEEYLGFCLNKVNNWEELRESFINRRLAIINWEDDQPNYLWVCNQTPAINEQVTPVEEPTMNHLNMTLDQAIKLVKEYAEAAALINEVTPRIKSLEDELSILKAREAAIETELASLRQTKLPDSKEVESIIQLAHSLKPLAH